MSQRENKEPSSPAGRTLRCDEWEDLIADALDGALPPAEAAAFARHHSECALCAQMLKETEQGRAWMQYLAPEPEVPAGLLAKILARTSGQAEAAAGQGTALPVQAAPAGNPRRLLPAIYRARNLARVAFEPRLMMTLAMAFFSIALTLNITGVNLRQLRAADLQPSRLRATLTRQYYATNEQVTKYYLNLRLVYEMEARVRELRRSTEPEPAALDTTRPSSTPQDHPRQPARDGRDPTVPKGEMPSPEAGKPQGSNDRVAPLQMVRSVTPATAGAPSATEPAGWVPAGYRLSAKTYADKAQEDKQGKVRVFRALRPMTEDQAERSLV